MRNLYSLFAFSFSLEALEPEPQGRPKARLDMEAEIDFAGVPWPTSEPLLKVKLLAYLL